MSWRSKRDFVGVGFLEGQRAKGYNHRFFSTVACRPAPYAKKVIERQLQGVEPNVYLFAGSDAWNLAEHRRRSYGEGSALVLPVGDDPKRYSWPRLDSLCLLPGDAEGEIVRQLIVCLLASGCRCIVELRPDQEAVLHYARKTAA